METGQDEKGRIDTDQVVREVKVLYARKEKFIRG